MIEHRSDCDRDPLECNCEAIAGTCTCEHYVPFDGPHSRACPLWPLRGTE